MTASLSALPDEQLRRVSAADQDEIFGAVAEGRAVVEVRLAPLAVAYAHRWHSVGGPRLYRSAWYLASAAVLLAVAYEAAQWCGVLLCAAALTLCPQFSRRRIERARRAEDRSRELLGWGPHASA